jgi:glycosyltransferase involved in cell wall biosynthesis
MALDGISRNLIESARAGRFVEADSPATFNTIIRNYLNHPEWIKNEGENGYNFVKANFDRQVLAEKYIQYLEKILLT